MKKALKISLLTVLLLGLMSFNAMAHEQQYDSTREPHEQPHKAEPPKGGHSSLANAATNPIANLVQFQIQNVYTSNSYNSGGDSNAFLLQPVNLFGQIYNNPNDDTDEVAPEWTYKLNLTFLFPT